MTKPAATIEFWFDFSSPYAYFASKSIEALAADHDRVVEWRPFMLGAAFKATGMTSLSNTPLRGDYARRDWARLARKARLAFSLPERHPIAALAPSRAFYWMAETAPGTESRFAALAFDAYFERGMDISEPDVTKEIARTCGVEPTLLSEAIATDRIKNRVREATDEALRRGIFGSPFFVVDGEPFWGHDRMPMLREWLAEPW